MTKDHEHRSIDLEIEVPGTPEEVWRAIASGPGIAAWMHPCEVEEREGGAFSYDMGGGMGGRDRVTAWEPPHRFAQAYEWTAEGVAPARLATEWLIEARSGGRCVVRTEEELTASAGRTASIAQTVTAVAGVAGVALLAIGLLA